MNIVTLRCPLLEVLELMEQEMMIPMLFIALMLRARRMAGEMLLESEIQHKDQVRMLFIALMLRACRFMAGEMLLEGEIQHKDRSRVQDFLEYRIKGAVSWLVWDPCWSQGVPQQCAPKPKLMFHVLMQRAILKFGMEVIYVIM